MKTLWLLIASILFMVHLQAQTWVDKTFSFTTLPDQQYAQAIDFGGVARTLSLDISLPQNQPSTCGRPLMMLIHGGAWLAGSKEDGNIVRMREDFASRGYAVASINYRLGQFNTSQFVNCNISNLFPIQWNCLNMADSSEWYRAYYRGLQDAQSALHFLIDNQSSYQIDAQNIFIVGESAGAFIALGLGYTDTQAEVLAAAAQLPTVSPPNKLYEKNCIQDPGLAANIEALELQRPDLGGYNGQRITPSGKTYRIKGVGSFYGAVFNDLFSNSPADPPALYMFHQPCDLIVPLGRSRIFQGYQECLRGFPANCGFLISRPTSIGSGAIKSILDQLNREGKTVPRTLFEITDNTYNCLQQTDPALSCHTFDNFELRTRNLALFFSSAIKACTPSSIGAQEGSPISIFPNPAVAFINVELPEEIEFAEARLINALGQTIPTSSTFQLGAVRLSWNRAPAGWYILELHSQLGTTRHKVQIIQ